jgi:hypothetical protein
MSIKAYEVHKVLAAVPAGIHGVVGGSGSTGPFVNGGSTPGTTGTLGATGAAGSPIDTLGWGKAQIVANTQGATGTNQSVAVVAKAGSSDWFSNSATTAVGSFSMTINQTSQYVQVGEIDLKKLPGRYLWLQHSITGIGQSKFGIDVILSQPDKAPGDQSAVSEY